MYWKTMAAVCLPESGYLQSHIAKSLAPAKFTKKLALQCLGVPFCEDCQRYSKRAKRAVERAKLKET